MTILDTLQRRPPYPVFNEKGITPVPNPFGPVDLRPSGIGPGYSVYSSAHGRNLAGMGQFDNKNAEGIETYPNELNKLAEYDDVNGNGVFDPNDTHGNVHPEDGIFQDHESMPGYIDRDKFYTPSEVTDLTQPDGVVMYVPGGAVSFQQGQKETYEAQQLLWELPPSMSPVPVQTPPWRGTVNAPTATRPVSGLGQEVEEGNGNGNGNGNGGMNPYMVAAGVGLVVGVGFLFMRGKK